MNYQQYYAVILFGLIPQIHHKQTLTKSHHNHRTENISCDLWCCVVLDAVVEWLCV